MTKTYDKRDIYWAIGQIQGEDACEFIVANYENEIEEVQNEMIKGLEMRKLLNDKTILFYFNQKFLQILVILHVPVQERNTFTFN